MSFSVVIRKLLALNADKFWLNVAQWVGGVSGVTSLFCEKVLENQALGRFVMVFECWRRLAGMVGTCLRLQHREWWYTGFGIWFHAQACGSVSSRLEVQSRFRTCTFDAPNRKKT